MDFLDVIMSRRRIRKYKRDKVPKSHVRKILEAVMNAPSQKNERPWHFVLIDNRKVSNKILLFIQTQRCSMMHQWPF
ncbi:MAG: nitroreductase family protein [Methanofastidiosum sp.]|jgi:nitroreductase|nr:nitroreductase family protein [Methanofastidiosum sp.]